MENGFAHTDLEEYDLLFDQHFHGRNIKIEEGGKVAQKIKKGAKEALVVTNRPLSNNELFEVELGEGNGGFKGVKREVKSALKGKESIRIGVTAHCPADVVSMSAQRSMKRMDSKTWMMMAESVVESGEVTQTLQKYSLKELSNGDRVGIIYLPEFNGSLAVYINGAPLGIIATSVPENVYGFVELQGECSQVCTTQNRTIQQEALPLEIRSMRERQTEIKQLKVQLAEKEETIETLQGQMEMMRKQVMMLKASTGRNRHSSTKLADITQDTETQTTPSLGNGRLPSSPSSSNGNRENRKSRGKCTIL